jgi:hypothetical protein
MTLRDRVRSLLGFADPDVDARPDTPTTTLSIDDIGAVLENERRREVTRIVVDHYQETEQPVSLGDLADVVAAHENDKPLDLVSSDERKRVYVSLYQIHLPKLEDMGVIVYGDNMDAITPTADANAVCDILETARDIQADPDNVSDAPRSALERDTPTGGDLRYYDSRDLAETATENRGDQA